MNNNKIIRAKHLHMEDTFLHMIVTSEGVHEWRGYVSGVFMEVEKRLYDVTEEISAGTSVVIVDQRHPLYRHCGVVTYIGDRGRVQVYLIASDQNAALSIDQIKNDEKDAGEVEFSDLLAYTHNHDDASEFAATMVRDDE